MENENIIEQGVTISDLLFLVKKNIITVVIVTLLFVLIGGLYGFKFKKTTYTASSTALISIDMSGTTTSASNYQITNYLTSTFTDIIVCEPVLTATRLELENININITNEQIKSAVSITSKANSLLLKINVSTSSKELTQAIANIILDKSIAMSNQMKESLNQTGETELVAEYPALYDKLNVVEKVEDIDSVIGKRGATLVLMVSFLLGCIVSGAIIFVKYLLDDTYTSKELFEKTYKINVFASLQEVITEESSIGGIKNDTV